MKDKLKEVKNIQYFTKGNRGLLYTGNYKKKKVVIFLLPGSPNAVR